MSENLFTLYPHLKQYCSIDNKVNMDSVLAGARKRVLFTYDAPHN